MLQIYRSGDLGIFTRLHSIRVSVIFGDERLTPGGCCRCDDFSNGGMVGNRLGISAHEYLGSSAQMPFSS